jgi:tRNA U38,U39,U40 pseudouridine synthase TruA
MGRKPVRQRPPNPEKIKDIVESLLPAKRRYKRVAYLFKRWECRKVRRKVRSYLYSVDKEGFTDRNLLLKPYQTPNVEGRRYGDKLSSFYRWAYSHTKGMSQADALSYVRKHLPRNVIGDHAFSHWEIEVKWRWRNQPPRSPNGDGDFFVLCQPLFPAQACLWAIQLISTSNPASCTPTVVRTG